MSKTLLLVDLSNVYWTLYHVTSDKPLSEAFEATVSKVHGLRGGFDFCVCCCDAKAPYFRHELLPSYKANRETAPLQAVEQFARVKERLRKDGLLLWGADGFEADDVIATATARAIEEGLGVTVASADKDLLQLVDDDKGVRVFSPFTEKLMMRTQVIEKFGVSPEMMGDLLALTGDKSDNVPGVPGVGVVTAAKLLHQWGTLDDVLFNADKNTPKLCESLIAHAEAARLARRLVQLRHDVPIDWAELFADRRPEPLTDEAEAEWTDDEAQALISAPPKADTDRAPPPSAEPASEAKSEPREGPGIRSIVVAPSTLPVEWNLQLEPRTLEVARRLAIDLNESRLFAKKFHSAEAIFAVIIRGREMGIGALTALAVTHFFEDKMSLDAHYIVSKAKEHPDCEFFQFLGGDDTYAEWHTKNRRNPGPTKHRYTIEQAKLAGLLRPSRSGYPSNWTLRPQELLRKTAAVQLVRIEYPSAALGLYCTEELGVEDAA